MNIITILDNIILSDTININKTFMDEYNINQILIVELDIYPIIDEEKFMNTNKFTIISNPTNINFEHSNNIILNFLLSDSGNLLIVSKNNLLGFIIIVGFMIRYLKISLLDCLILGMSKNIRGLYNSIYIHHLNEYHLYLKNNFK
jgi:hypothetical protein